MRTKKKQRNSRSKKIKRGTNIKRHVKRRNNIKTKNLRRRVKQKYNVKTKNRNKKMKYSKMKYSKLYGGVDRGVEGNWTDVEIPDKETIRSNPVKGIEGIKNIIEMLNFCAIIFKRGLYDIYLKFYKKTIDLFEEKDSVELVKEYPIFELVKDNFGYIDVYFNKSLLEILTDKKFNDIIKELNNTKYKLKKSSIYLTPRSDSRKEKQKFEKDFLNFDDVITINKYCKNLINKLKIIAKQFARFKTGDTILSKAFQTEMYEKLQSDNDINTDLFCSCSLFKVLMDQYSDPIALIDRYASSDRGTINEIINKLMLIIVNCFYKLSLYKYRTPNILKKDKVIYKVLELTGKLDLNEDTRLTDLQDRINGLDEQMELIEADAINLIEAKKRFGNPSANQTASWQRQEEDINSRRDKNSQEREKLNSELTSLQSYQLSGHEGGSVDEDLSEKLKYLLSVELSSDNIKKIKIILGNMEGEDKYNKEPFKSMLNKFKKFIEKYEKYINSKTDDNYLLLLGSIKQIRDHKITEAGDDDDDEIIRLIKQFVEYYNKALPTRNTKKEKGLDSKYAYYITLIKNLIIIATDISNINVKSLTENISKFKKKISGDGISDVIVTNISDAYKNLKESITKYDLDKIKSKIDDKYLTFLGTLNIQFGGLNKFINNSDEYRGGGITEIVDIQDVLKSLVTDHEEYKELYLLLELINNKSVDFSGNKISYSKILENFLGNNNPFSTFYKNLDRADKNKIKGILNPLNGLINELNNREINGNLKQILELSNIINEQKGLRNHIENLSLPGLPMDLMELQALYGNSPKPEHVLNHENYTKVVTRQGELLDVEFLQGDITFDSGNPNIIILSNLVNQLESLVTMTINESNITTIYEYIEKRAHDVFSEYIENFRGLETPGATNTRGFSPDDVQEAARLKTTHDNIKTYLSIKGISNENKKKLNVYDKLLYLLLNLDEVYNYSCNKFIEKGLLTDEPLGSSPSDEKEEELRRRLEAIDAPYSLHGGANPGRDLIETDETSKTDFIKLFYDLFTNNKLGNNDISNLYEFFPSLKVLILNIYINGISVGGGGDNYILGIKNYSDAFLAMLPKITKLIEELNIKVNGDEKLKEDVKLKESTLKLLRKIEETILKTYYEALANIDPIDDDKLNLQSKINEILQPLIDNYTDSVKGEIDLSQSGDEKIDRLKQAGDALSSISFSSKLKIKDSPFVNTILLDANFTSNVGIITRLTNSETVTFNAVKGKEVMDDLSELGKVISLCLDSGRTGLTKKLLLDDIKIENNKTLELINSLMKDPNLIKILENMLGGGGSEYIDPLSDQIKQDLIKLSEKIDTLKL